MFTFKVLNLLRKNFGRWVTATASRPKPRPSFKPRLEWLEGRLTPGGGGGNTDILVWKPVNNSQDPSLSANWYDQNQGKSGVTIPSASNPVIFDGSVSNSPITWGAMVVKSMTLQKGYNALMTESSTTTDAGTFTEGATETLNMYFNNNMIFQIGGGGYITNMTLSGYPTAQLQLTGGTMTIAESSGYKESTGVNILVSTNATLTDESYTPLKYTNSKLNLTVNGTMNVFFGTGGGMTIIDRNGFSRDVIDVSGGTLNYLGSGGVADTFDMNVKVEGGGNFIVTSAGNGSSGGSLTVKGDPAYSSVYLTGGGPSTIQLSKGATLNAYNGYLQDGGTLETMDSSTCTVSTNGSVAAQITGGYVWVDNGAGYGTLNMNCDLYFAGTLVVEVQGNASGPGTYDLFNVSGTMKINNGAGLTVIVNGNLVGGNKWVVITSKGTLNQDFSKFTIPDGINTTLNFPEDGSYQLSA